MVINMHTYNALIQALHKGKVLDGSFFKRDIKDTFSYQVLPVQGYSKKATWFNELESVYQIALTQNLLKDLVIHGSYGDFTQINFSDIELTLVIDESCFFDANQARKFSKWYRKKMLPFILKIDPLQHHGCFYLWKDFMSQYDEKILPSVAYQQCWSMSGQEFKLLSNTNDDDFRSDALTKYKSTLSSLLNYDKTFFRYGMNLYSIKRLLSNFFMIPVFYYQLHGQKINKRQAINKFKTDDAPVSFVDALEKASRIRDGWPKSEEWMKMFRRGVVRGYLIPGGRFDLVMVNCLQNNLVRNGFTQDFLPLMNKGLVELIAKDDSEWK